MPDVPKLTGKFVHVPLDIAIYNEFVLRTADPECNVAAYVEGAVLGFLERTADDGDIWTSEAYWVQRADEEHDQSIEEYGAPGRGYQWSQLFLPNGSELKMTYKGRTSHARVSHEQIIYDGKPYSPSQLASLLADNTSRNAWRDLWIKRPSDKDWRLAADLRRAG